MTDAVSVTSAATQSNQLCVIDGDVSSLDDVLQGQYHYTSIMVHFNNISSLDRNVLCLLNKLQVLDLSANKLCNDAIHVLSDITSGLTHLNISSNENITSLQPIFKKHSALSNSLQSLDASFNFIDDNGLISLSNAKSLQLLHLHGNAIETLDSVFTHLSPIKSLRSLYLQKNGRDKNPVCNIAEYHEQMSSEFIQLEHLDDDSSHSGAAVKNALIESIMNAHASKDEPDLNSRMQRFLSVPKLNGDDFGPQTPQSARKSKIPVPRGSPMTPRPVHTTLARTHQAELDLQLEQNMELQRELSDEKHRRFKAEEDRLQLQHKIGLHESDIHSLKTECERLTAQSNKLKDALFAAKKTIERAVEERDAIKRKFDTRESKIKEVSQKTAHITKITSTLETDLLNEKHKSQKLALENQTLLENAEKHKIMQEELDHLKRKNEYLQTEHEMEVKKVKSSILDEENSDFREKCQKVLRQAEERMRHRLDNVTIENGSLKRQYQDLENEFRQALVLETSKYEKLETQKETLEKEVKSTQKTRDELEKNLAIQTEKLKEWQIVVRESRAKIETMQSGSEEKNGVWRARLEAVERELVTQRKLAAMVEPLKQEKARLLSRVTAHESVMEGLKQERGKWTEELSQKGFELANERGRLEAQISSLQAENGRVVKSMADAEDAIKIKAKMIENQTTSIRELKQKLSEKVKYQDKQGEIEGLQEEVRKLFGRKEELKFDNQRLKDQLETYQTRWKDKANVMERLEEQVRRMKKRDQDKIAVLNEEKSALYEKLQKAEIIVQKTEERFNQQLQLHDARHEKSLRSQRAKFETALNVSNEKIIRVEDEMRQILLQQETERRKLEDKYKHVGEAFKLLQRGLN